MKRRKHTCDESERYYYQTDGDGSLKERCPHIFTHDRRIGSVACTAECPQCLGHSDDDYWVVCKILEPVYKHRPIKSFITITIS